ncbi:MAG: DUF1207 domain-containing protein [Pirellulales bacterium]
MSSTRSTATRICALALGVCLECASFDATAAHDGGLTGAAANTFTPNVAGAWDGAIESGQQSPQAFASDETWIAPPAERSQWVDANVYVSDPNWDGMALSDSCPSPAEAWYWQVLPDGLIYRSYQAGVHEPRLAIVAFHESGSESFWDGALGGRVGLLRYGTGGAIYPQGWQVDVEAAAMVRLTLDEIRDFETADYRVGVPVTYGIDNWQFKFAAYHLSSHLGDEFILAHLPGSLADRINYVRDAVVLGASYFPHPAWRLYSEAAYAINVDGGAEPWEFQFGTEVSRPGPTGLRGTPFWAVNGHLREEHNFGGDVNTQLGWLWRGQSGQVMRFGLHYFNGKSSQYQMFDESEEQIGAGLWYDY